MEPCAPRPNRRICRLSAADVIGPALPATVPAGPTMTCWPSTTAGSGKRSSRPSSIMARAPSAVSSPGWKTAISVPRHASRACASSAAAPEPSHVHVVAAHVPHRHRVPVAVFRHDLAGIGQVGRFLDGKRVHVGAQHDRGPVAVAEQADDAGPAHARRHLVAGGPKPVRGQAGRPRLLHRQLGMRVNVLVERFEIREQAVEIRQDRACGGGCDVLMGLALRSSAAWRGG